MHAPCLVHETAVFILTPSAFGERRNEDNISRYSCERCDRVTLKWRGPRSHSRLATSPRGGGPGASKQAQASKQGEKQGRCLGGAGSGSDYLTPAPRAGVNLYLQVDKTRLAGPHETTNVRKAWPQRAQPTQRHPKGEGVAQTPQIVWGVGVPVLVRPPLVLSIARQRPECGDRLSCELSLSLSLSHFSATLRSCASILAAMGW